MRLGAVLLPSSTNSAPGDLAERARQLEDIGYDSLWAIQAVGRGRFLPDPLQTLAAAAAATRRPMLGTAVLQLPLYTTPALAHQLLSLRHLAGDRLSIGVGAGSTENDFRVFGRDFGNRFVRFDQQVVELRHILATAEVGDLKLSPSANSPGGPPLLYGTWGKRVVRAAHEFSGWIGSALYRSEAQLISSLGVYRANGGKRAIISSVALGAGKPSDHRARLDAFAQAGFDEAVVMLRPDGPKAEEVRGWVG